jgi:pyrroloquinoline quinone biosynthesis protein E
MPDPCRSYDCREIDFGGCRCRAFQFTGGAARTDPDRDLSPDHAIAAETEETRLSDGVLIPRPHPGG